MPTGELLQAFAVQGCVTVGNLVDPPGTLCTVEGTGVTSTWSFTGKTWMQPGIGLVAGSACAYGAVWTAQSDSRDRLWFCAFYALLAVWFAAVGVRSLGGARVSTDAGGLTLRTPSWPVRRYRWSEVTEVRTAEARRLREPSRRLVVVLTTGRAVSPRELIVPLGSASDVRLAQVVESAHAFLGC